MSLLCLPQLGRALRGSVDRQHTTRQTCSNLIHQLFLTVMTDTRRRVKLYALNAERQWDDRGTGHVTSSYVERLKGVSLLVRAESDGN